ncbi:sugar ABC transporter substrate-binding protein [Actinoplanes sp. GCM10030250]|uniref:sugar ABC transporter substrate-binding protein n=1 Tax=Actinoplanes sp. GCM10030250 TaxID=3273376 RepID=UPI0036229867
MRHRLGGIGAALLLTVCGCSGSGDNETPGIALVVANSKLNFAVEMGHGFEAGVARVGGVNATVTGPDIVDGPRQLQIFQDLKKTADDGISVFTLNMEIFARPIADAVAEDIPIIAVDNPPLAAADVGLFIGNDNYELGRMLADLALAKMPSSATGGAASATGGAASATGGAASAAGGGGTVVIGTSNPGAKVLDRRAKGIRERIEEKLPGVTVIGPFDTKQDTSANQAAWRTLIKANPGALAFLGTGDADGWNLAAIRKEIGGKWVAGAFDLDPRSLAAVKESHLVLVSPEHFVKGAVAGRIQAEHAKSGKDLPEGWIYIPGLAVSPANIDAVLARQQSVEATTQAVAAQVDTILTDKTYLRGMENAG